MTRSETTPRHILIVGANSYIGKKLEEYLARWPDDYEVHSISVREKKLTSHMFAGYDVVFHAVGIAHIRETKQNRNLYYEINRDLAIDTARAAKAGGVRQFILLSSMSVYGLTTGQIRKDTAPRPANAYGDSKLQADESIEAISDQSFRFACLRPPMVYGKDCKGNYQLLRRFALSAPLFPDIDNRRSMVYIDNLCEFIKRVIDSEAAGVFFPQNAEYMNTTQMVKLIAEANGKRIRTTRIFNPAIRALRMDLVNKVFGDLTYEPVDTVEMRGIRESIFLTEDRNS